MRGGKRILIVPALIAFLIGAWTGWDWSHSTRHSLRDFDPHEVARLEARMWRSYYDHRSFRLFSDLVTLLRQQYHLPLSRASVAAYHAARAAVVFQRGHNRPEYLLAMPDLVRYYGLIRAASTEAFVVDQVSAEELEWWIVHRHRDEHRAGDLAQALAIEQADIYRQPASDFAEHATARADAMLLRDTGAEKGGVSEEGWNRIATLLDDSWSSLYRVVRR